jgi:protein-L-isoaspartate(D-aspartate) O-methyltransferase
VVVGIEHIPSLAALAEKNIRADGLGKAVDERGIVLVTGDGRLGAFLPFCSGAKKKKKKPRESIFIYIYIFGVVVLWCIVGYAEKGPYDAIHVGAAARTIPPALVEQLATPGRMIIPVGTYSQKLMQVDKDAQGQITQSDLFGVVVRILSFCLPATDVVQCLYFFLFRASSMCR